jgi:hypothetical protein
VAEGAGLENRCTRKGIVGSNPTLSVFAHAFRSYREAGAIPPISFLAFSQAVFLLAMLGASSGQPHCEAPDRITRPVFELRQLTPKYVRQHTDLPR